MNNALTSELQRQVCAIAVALTGSATSTHDDVLSEIDALQTVELSHSMAQLRLPASAAMQAAFDEAAAPPHRVLRYLTDAHEALEGMSDSDIDHFETDEEDAGGAPAQFAARRIMQAIHMLSRLSIMAPAALSQAAHDVLLERRRQLDVKDWTPEHDDAHPSGEIAAFAALYALPPAAREWPASETGYGNTWGAALCPVSWEPKFGTRRRDLIKAGALILAEIERLDRAAAAAPQKGGA